MKNMLKIGVITAALALSPMAYANSFKPNPTAQAQHSLSQTAPSETRIRIGLAGKTPNQAVQGIDVTTAQIDAVLRDVGNPIGISGNPSRDLANRIFQDIDDAYTDFENLLRAELLKDSKINRVYELEFSVNPAMLQLSQDQTRIGAKIGQVDGRVSFKYEAGLCGSYRVNFAIEDFRVQGDYDVYDGYIKNVGVDYDIRQLGADPYSVRGWICKNVLDGIVKIATGDGIKTNLIKEARKQVDNAIMEAEMERLFSLRDFLDSSEAFVRAIDTPGFRFADYNLRTIGNEARDDAADAIREVNDMLGSPSFQGTGLRVTFELFDGSTNLISLIVSHAPARVSVEVEDECGRASVSFGVQTEQVDIYSRPPYSWAGWTKEKTVYRGGEYSIGELVEDREFIAIGKNRLIGNLYTKPEVDNVFHYRHDYNRPRKIYRTFCEGSLDDGDFPGFPSGF